MRPMTARRRLKNSRPAAIVGGLGIGVLAGCWTACTVTPQNYKLLSLFFDGVPDPSAPAGRIDPRTGAAVGAPIVSIHAPYAAEQCSECHRSRFSITRADSSACVRCHAEKTSEHTRMHGPVAAGACLWCHEPHESPFAVLLRAESRALCAQCHTAELLDTTREPAHADPARPCLDCHFGHGGPERYMLRLEPAASGREGTVPGT